MATREYYLREAIRELATAVEGLTVLVRGLNPGADSQLEQVSVAVTAARLAVQYAEKASS